MDSFFEMSLLALLFIALAAPFAFHRLFPEQHKEEQEDEAA